MREIFTYGSVRGRRGNPAVYSIRHSLLATIGDIREKLLKKVDKKVNNEEKGQFMEETIKETFIKAIQAQPDDSTAEELLKELAFHRMILRGLKDSDEGRTITHEEMGKKIKSWAKK